MLLTRQELSDTFFRSCMSVGPPTLVVPRNVGKCVQSKGPSELPRATKPYRLGDDVATLKHVSAFTTLSSLGIWCTRNMIFCNASSCQHRQRHAMLLSKSQSIRTQHILHVNGLVFTPPSCPLPPHLHPPEPSSPASRPPPGAPSAPPRACPSSAH